MSTAELMTKGRKMSGGDTVKTSHVRRKSLLNGIIQGFSGPALFAAEPSTLKTMVSVEGNRVRLKLPHRSGRTSVKLFGSHEEALVVARALAQATEVVMGHSGLEIGSERIKRLDHEGKLRERSRLRVQRRIKDGPRQ